MHYEKSLQNKRGILYESMEVVQLEDLEYTEEESIFHRSYSWEKVDIKEFVNIMLSYFDDSNCILTKDMLNIVSSNKQFIYNYSMFIKPLIEIIEKFEMKIKTDMYDGMSISEIPWNDSFKNLLKERYVDYVNQSKFLELFDYGKLGEHILSADQCEIHNFCDAIESIYKYSNIAEIFTHDCEIVNKISRFIDENFDKLVNQSKSRTMEIALRRLRSIFREYRKTFGYDEEDF